MTDIRRKTCIIIRKNGEYFVGYKIWSDEMTWSNSVYDAWRTRDRELAAKVARKTGGIMVLFNPIVNQKKVMGA